MLETQVLVILAFYTGLRKSELRSRLLEDISIYGNKIYVDVNSDGLKRLNLKLKTSNAKRRVGAIIEDELHLRILEDFFTMRSKIVNKSKFLFLQVKRTEVLVDDETHIKYAVKSKALPEIEFDNVTAILQSLTGRYVTFHSFRHSYASYEVKRIIENPSADPHQLIDLAVRMGHESPETTLKIYAHRSLLEMGGVKC
jgi:integrase